MRIGIAALATAAGIAGPMLIGPRLLGDGTPRQVIWYALVSLGALVAGFTILLAALVDASSLPFRDLPVLVSRCIDAAGQVLAHPARHWPRIGAAVLLLALLARLLWALLAVIHDARGELHGLALLGNHAREGNRRGLLVVRSDRPFALAAGILRRRVVASDALMRLLTTDERHAVIAHERAHLRGWHPLLWLLGRSVGRAFPFLPPAREAAQQLLMGLEMSADDAAARSVGDPLVVARAIVRLADRGQTPDAGLAVASAGVGPRVKRLLRAQHPRSAGARFRAVSAIGTILLLVSLLAFAVPMSVGAPTGRDRAEAFHAACHLPHRTSSS
jgi:Zn-dependent protease with chaperone function